MNSVKAAFALTSSILILLLILLGFIKKPEKELYNKAVEMVMTHERLTSTQEAMDYCPELKSIQQQMDRIGRLNSDIHGLTAGPASSISESQSKEILVMNREIQMLRFGVKKELIALMETYKEGQSTEIVGLRN